MNLANKKFQEKHIKTHFQYIQYTQTITNKHF